MEIMPKQKDLGDSLINSFIFCLDKNNQENSLEYHEKTKVLEGREQELKSMKMEIQKREEEVLKEKRKLRVKFNELLLEAQKVVKDKAREDK